MKTCMEGAFLSLCEVRQKASIRRGLQHDLSLEELENQRPTKIARPRIYQKVFGGSKGKQWRRCHSYESEHHVTHPISVKPLDERVKTLCGVIESYELEFEHDNFVPLLLSLPNQATLGLTKDMRNGTASLKDYQVEIELCKAKQNNLFCINIRALGEALKYREKLPRN